MPVDKAIFWPQGQEICLASMSHGAMPAVGSVVIASRAPDGCKVVDRAPIVRVES